MVPSSASRNATRQDFLLRRFDVGEPHRTLRRDVVFQDLGRALRHVLEDLLLDLLVRGLERDRQHVGLHLAQDRLDAAVVDLEQVLEHEQRVLDLLAELRSCALIASIIDVWPLAPSKLSMSAAALTPPSRAVLSCVASFVWRSTIASSSCSAVSGTSSRRAMRTATSACTAAVETPSTSAACWLGRCARIVATICGCSLLDDLRDRARIHPLQCVDSGRVAALQDPAEQSARATLAERLGQHLAQILGRADADRTSCLARRRATRRARP